MAYYALIYDLVDDYLARRAAFREEHLRLAAEAHASSELVMGGAFADPADKALLVFRGDDRSVAESFARNDPYVRNGLIKRWEVRPWTVVIGNPDVTGSASP
ncbi:MAG TPA: YciI-like protein [Candidatus Polarisedimenticolia bacterium]|nr:YciI-like protein [Candidatus Polarisedimenticolia bacterium]